MTPYHSHQDLLAMLRKYLEGSATADEKAFIEKWYFFFEKEPDALDRFSDQEISAIEKRMEDRLTANTGLKKKTIPPAPARNTKPFWRLRTAAILLLAAFAGVLYYLHSAKQPASQAPTAQDLEPGKDRAVLTLSDGSSILLDNAATGMLARQGDATIHKVGSGLVACYGHGKYAAGKFNTVTAPAGGKYSVILPDGTRVWLNSESSIRFPTAFPENERRVLVSGEVYFEVAKDRARPFVADARGIQEVKVLGTHFNLNAYEDEAAITTTVLEGKVEVKPAGAVRKPVQLSPGEQAACSGAGAIDVHKSVDTDEIMAWKNGMFRFEKADIFTVMRQLSRWYNMEVIFDEGLSDKKFSGKISRSMNASEALEILSFTGVNFRLEKSSDPARKSRIVVMP